MQKLIKAQQSHLSARDPKVNGFIHTLPKAIQIFQILQHVKKSIYPFEMISKTHKSMSYEQEPYYRQTGQRQPGGQKFRPALDNIKSHFQKDYLIYDKFNNNSDEQLFNQNIYSLQKLKNLKNVDYIITQQFTQPLECSAGPQLKFNSRFQSGNLSMVSFVQGVYYLLLHNDVNTSGYTSWFYFSARNKTKGRHRFAILNYGKAGTMHNQGIKICICGKDGWKRAGDNIFCQPNRNLFKKGHYLNFSTLYFQFNFEADDSQIYFSYNVPYTYNDLYSFLNKIEEDNLPYFNRKLAGISLAGNRLQLLTITNFSLLNQGYDLPVIVLMARTHPGQTVSSWIMHEFMKFLISNDPEAISLRNNFVFKIFPMVNPDGVIHGNYRCSLAGRDLNRRWNQPNKQIFPQVYFIKNQILQISKKRQIKAIIDLHGHTKKKKIFAYGCNNRNQPHRCRLFPYIVSKLTSYFQFRFCNFFMNRCKFGTARISLYNQLKIPYIYTIETSQFGTYQGHLSLKVFLQIAIAISKSFIILFRIKNNSKQIKNKNENEKQDKLKPSSTQEQQKFDKIEAQLLNDASLIKIGNQNDSGSQSEPSVDNIKFDKLEKMIKRKQMRPDNRINRCKQKIVKICGDSSQNLQKFQSTLPVRPKTSQTNRKRYPQLQIKKMSEGEPEIKKIKSRPKSHIMQNQGRFYTHKSQNPSQKQVLPIKRRTQALNFINLSLSIFDDQNKYSKSHRTGSIVENFKEFNQNFISKLKLGPRNYYQFRRLK